MVTFHALEWVLASKVGSFNPFVWKAIAAAILVGAADVGLVLAL